MNHIQRTFGFATCAFALAFAGASAIAQTAARDSAVDSLRAPTETEAQALRPAAKAGARIGMNTGKVDPKPIVYRNGTVEQELDASTMSYTVARRNADGSMSMVCVTGEDQMKQALKAPTARSKSVAAKEHQHDVK